MIIVIEKKLYRDIYKKHNKLFSANDLTIVKYEDISLATCGDA